MLLYNIHPYIAVHNPLTSHYITSRHDSYTWSVVAERMHQILPPFLSSCRAGVGDGPIACVLYFNSKLGR